MADKADKENEVDEIQRKETWRDFLYNSNKGEVLGRTGMSWCKIGVFYAIFYACLVGWFAGLLHAFDASLDKTAPTYYGENSLTQANPALGMRPMPRFDSTMIRFAQAKKSSYRPYVDHLEAFIKTYENVSDAVDCSSGERPKEGKACKIDIREHLTNLGCTRETDYGYFAGTPCVVLKMNKLYDFTPNPYATFADLEKDLDKETGERLGYQSYADGNTGVSCDGQNALDKQNIDLIEFSPSTGLDAIYFPYRNQDGYRSPVVVAKLSNVQKRVTIQFNCRLWAMNIDNSDGKRKSGTMHFELYIN